MALLTAHGPLWRRLAIIAAFGTALACAALVATDGVAVAAEAPTISGPDDAGGTDPAPDEESGEEEGASTISTVFYWVVATGALIYLVVTRRGDRKSGKHEETALRTAERKRMVREELVERSRTKVDDETRKADALEAQGAPERQVTEARGKAAMAEKQLKDHLIELELAKEREREALEALEAHQQAVELEAERKRREAQGEDT
ncbi:MAG: hypothetical protein WDZ57_01240 [Demequina sp.]